MKKITLSALIIFAMIFLVAFIGDVLNYQNDNKIKQSKNNTVDITKYINNNINVNKTSFSTGDHLNSPNINIDKLTFDLMRPTTESFTINEVSKHNLKKDCYLVINNNVYDVSSYIGYHPAGSRTIISRCGKEVTGIFARIHSNRAWDLLKKYKIGTIITNKADTTSQILTAISNALKKANPSAEILKVKPKASFYVAKIIYNNKLYEIHINNNGQIIKEEVEDDESDWSLWGKDKDDN